MDAIAFIYGETFIYWNSVIIFFAAVVAVCVFLSVYLGSSGNAVGAAVTVPMALTVSIVLGRLIDWYCRPDSYQSLQSALTDYTSGKYALIGAFAGCLIVAVLLRMICVIRNLPQLLDALSLGGSAGIAVGRLACFYNTSDRGMILEGITQLPLACPVMNPVTGETEYRLATFMLQSLATGGIFFVLLLFYIIGKSRKKTPDGDATLLFMMLYGASQIVLDSTRYDSLYLRSNGFISIVQILGAVGVVLPLIIFSVRLIRRRGWRWLYLLSWSLCVAALSTAGYMEYYVQRHGDQALFAYSVMSGCLLLTILIGLTIRLVSMRRCGGKYAVDKV